MNSQRLTTTLLVIISTVLIILLILIAAPYILKLFGSTGEQTEIGYSSETVRAEVIAIQEEGVTEVAGNEQTYQVLEVQILIRAVPHHTRDWKEPGSASGLPI
jgi:flagellar basal body-associated protein FliL